MVLNETITAQRAKNGYEHLREERCFDDIANLKGKIQIQPNVVEVRTSDSKEQYNVAVEANKDNPELHARFGDCGSNRHAGKIPSADNS